jgi:hypothetical protein
VPRVLNNSYSASSLRPLPNYLRKKLTKTTAAMSKVDDKHASSDEKLDVIEHVSRPSSSCDDIEASSQSEADEKFTRATK